MEFNLKLVLGFNGYVIQYSHHRPVWMAPNPDSSIWNFKVNQDQSATSISSGPCLNAHKMNKAAGSIKKKTDFFFLQDYTVEAPRKES